MEPLGPCEGARRCERVMKPRTGDRSFHVEHGEHRNVCDHRSVVLPRLIRPLPSGMFHVEPIDVRTSTAPAVVGTYGPSSARRSTWNTENTQPRQPPARVSLLPDVCNATRSTWNASRRTGALPSNCEQQHVPRGTRGTTSTHRPPARITSRPRPEGPRRLTFHVERVPKEQALCSMPTAGRRPARFRYVPRGTRTAAPTRPTSARMT